jgi:hypothetical protein
LNVSRGRSSWGKRGVWLAITALVLGGCSSETPRTQVMVVIDADPGVRADAVDLLVEVSAGPNRDAMTGVFDEQVGAPIAWPVQLALVPEGGEAGREYRVEVSARDGGAVPVAYVQVVSGYVRGATKQLHLRLEDACRDAWPSCGAEERCVAGACVDAYVDPGGLPDFGVDAGPGDDAGLDAGPLDDAEVDAGAGDAEVDATPDDAAPPDACVDVPLTVEELRVEVMLIIDRSCTMSEAMDDGTERWQAWRDAVARAANEYQERLALGAMRVAHEPLVGCPASHSIEPAYRQADQVVALLSEETSPCGLVPEQDHLSAVGDGAIDALRLVTDAPRRRAWVATDANVSSCGGEDETMALLEEAAANGLQVSVFDMGATMPPDILAELGAVGGGAGVPVHSTGELEADLLSRMASAIPCTLEVPDLAGTVGPCPEGVHVRLDGTDLTCDDSAAGWRWTGTSVQLFGPSCETWQQAAPPSLEVTLCQ